MFLNILPKQSEISGVISPSPVPCGSWRQCWGNSWSIPLSVTIFPFEEKQDELCELVIHGKPGAAAVRYLLCASLQPNGSTSAGNDAVPKEQNSHG